jgi:hypothetical protein
MNSFALRAACLIFFAGFSLAWGQTDVLTQHNDNTREGLNPKETILTPANVTAGKFGKLFTRNVDGIIVAQPLYARNILMNDGLTHNVVFVATQHNTVYAFDADGGLNSAASPLWSVSLNDGGTSDPISDYGCTGTHYTEIGIMGTPVINAAKTTLYVVAKTLNGSVRNFSLHALNLATGADLSGSPVIITGSTPSHSGTVTFNPIFQMQRPALLLQGGNIYIGFGGNGCDVYDYHGWLFGYNAQNLQQVAAFNVSPDGSRGSIWQGGSGPAADSDGYIYFATANGDFDGPAGTTDYGDSVLKMGWSASGFGVVDFFTPYNQLQLAQQDLDLGSAGPLLLPNQPGLYPHELVVGGKQGTLYLIDADNPGQFNAQTDNVIQSIPGAVPGELLGVPSFWNGNLYLGSDGDYLKQYAFVNGNLTQQPVAQTTALFYGTGAESTSVSSNGNTSAILWAIRHSNAALFAFDATNIAHELYDSTQSGTRDQMVPVVHFVTPTIANGRVFIPGKTALQAYGLLPTLTAVGGNQQSGIEKAVLPTPLTLKAADSYTSHPVPGVTVTCTDKGAGGAFTPSTVQTTDANGQVAYTYRLPGTPRTVSISCSSPAYASASFTETVTLGPPARMIPVSGAGQTVGPKTALPTPIVVKVVDAASYPLAGVTINFSDNSAGGSFTATSGVSAANGTVTTQYTTGTKAQHVTISATTTTLKLNVGETCAPGPATAIAITGGNNQSGTAGTQLLRALGVLVTDQYGNRVSANGVSFSDGGAGGSFSASNPILTATNGIASVYYTLPSVPKIVTISAAAAGVSTHASFTETGH